MDRAEKIDSSLEKYASEITHQINSVKGRGA